MSKLRLAAYLGFAAYLGAGVNHAILWTLGSNASFAWGAVQIVIWPLWLYAAKSGDMWLVDWLPDAFFSTRGKL